MLGFGAWSLRLPKRTFSERFPERVLNPLDKQVQDVPFDRGFPERNASQDDSGARESVEAAIHVEKRRPV